MNRVSTLPTAATAPVFRQARPRWSLAIRGVLHVTGLGPRNASPQDAFHRNDPRLFTEAAPARSRFGVRARLHRTLSHEPSRFAPVTVTNPPVRAIAPPLPALTGWIDAKDTSLRLLQTDRLACTQSDR